MDKLEKVEKLRARANVSYDEAKKALEECKWDMLDALVKLENEGKINDQPTGEYSTKDETASLVPDPNGNTDWQYNQNQGPKQESGFSRLWKGFCSLIKKSCTNTLVATRHGEQLMELPVIVFILLLACFFWVILPLMIVSLFFNFTYNFRGPDLGKKSVNEAMEKATEMANDIKSDVTKNEK